MTFYDDFFCRYSYSEETGDDFDDEAVTAVGSGVKVSGEMATMLERKDRKASLTSLVDHHHVFGVIEDLEEDKRE